MTTDTAGPLQLAVVSAGLGVPSSTRLLADRLTEAVRTQLADAGREVEIHLVELRDLAADNADNLVTGFPSSTLEEAIETVTSADGLIAVTPVVPEARLDAASASYSGLFKSFFDVIDNDALTDTLPDRIKRAAAELAGLMRGRAGTAARAKSDDSAVVVPFAQQLEALRPA
ncbi:NAD(P)H-dependent oxidoreductase [Streptomyces sp. NPDC002143]